ncbi:MAG: bifunctional folylpolyglutamate synthase/dihydrofolate synthase [Vallitaleaceae bacterium]|nr:bifunctional folylpolyglutamate synthase/dihydrofolate synthase [Vallitaleaceae bacterium]
MTYQESDAFLQTISQIGSIYGLDQIYRLLEHLNNPQNDLKVIHVAGTNGKGSVTNLLATILMEGHFHVGLFNSPNILSFTETISYDGVSISETDFCSLTTEVQAAGQKMVLEGFPHPTVFECLTAIALLYFKNKGVDFAIVEVGLGGKDDATNVFARPLLSLITSISYDHTEYLGTTLESIARAKAGIIKPNCPIVLAANPSPIKDVVSSVAKELNASLYFVPPTKCHVQIEHETLSGVTFSIQTPYYYYNHLTTKLIGSHQLDNIAVALTAIEVLKTHWHYDISKEQIARGLASTYWSCRCEYLENPIPMIIDGAHNVDSLQGLLGILSKHQQHKKVTFLFGVFKDKNVHEMLKLMAPFSNDIVVTCPYSPRALPLEQLSDIASGIFDHVESEADPLLALELAITVAKKTNTLLCCVGSLSLAVPLRAALGKTIF